MLHLLRFKKLTFFLILTIIFITLIFLSNYFTSKQIQVKLSANLIEDFKHKEIEIAESVSRSIEHEIESLQTNLTLIAQLPEIRQPREEQCNQKLSDMSELLQGKVGNLGRVNKDRVFVCSLNKSLIGIQAESLGQYITDIFEDPQHRPVVSRAIKPVGATSYLVGVHIPVLDEKGLFNGTLGGAIYFDRIQAKYFNDIKLTQKSHVVLLDDNGDILYHPYINLIGKNIATDEFKKYASLSTYQNILNEALSGKTGTKSYIFDNELKAGAFSSIKVADNRQWVVLITTPQSEIEGKLITLNIASLFNTFIFLNILILGITSLVFLYIIAKNTKQLEEANIKLKSLDKLKDQFVSIASHELRTPMTAIKGLVSMINEGIFGTIPDKLKPPLKDVVLSTDRLINLVNDLLDVARIEAGRTKFKLSEFSLNATVDSTVSLLQTIAAKKNIALKKEKIPQEEVQADTDKIQQILNNLIGNSLKFTDQGKITVSGKLDGDKLILLISDTGIGISKENSDKLFGKFEQVSSDAVSRPPGTGLGLYISRELARKMGGNLWIEKSDPGVGSTFALSLPLAKTPAATKIKIELEKEAAIHPDQK